MEITTKNKSTLSFKKIIISKCNFERSEDTLENLKLKMRTRYTRNIPVGEMNPNEDKMILEISLKDGDGKLSLTVKCVAYFETSQEDDSSIISKNAIAIMFPYVRSYISSITSQPGMSPIILPLINVSEMSQED